MLLSVPFSVLVQPGAHYHRYHRFSCGCGLPSVPCSRCDILATLTSVATRFLFLLLQSFLFPFLAVECLLFLVAVSLAFGYSLNRRSLTLFSSNAGSRRVVFLYIAPVEHHSPHAFHFQLTKRHAQWCVLFSGDKPSDSHIRYSPGRWNHRRKLGVRRNRSPHNHHYSSLPYWGASRPDSGKARFCYHACYRHLSSSTTKCRTGFMHGRTSTAM
jgi:hypothetical protein